MEACDYACAPTQAHSELANFTCAHWLNVVTCATLAAPPFHCDACSGCCTERLGPAPPPAAPPPPPPPPSASLYASMALGGFAALLVCCLCYTLLCRRPRDTSRMSEEVSRGTRSRDYGGSKLETHLPRTRWPLGKRYACFLSHYKAEAGSDARYTRAILRRAILLGAIRRARL